MIADTLKIDPIIIEIIGLLASIFTIVTFIRWVFRKFKRRANKNLKNVEDAKNLLRDILYDKLYSKDSYTQYKAIIEIMQIVELDDNNKWAFSVFVERIRNNPKLSLENKNLVLSEIIKLCKKM